MTSAINPNNIDGAYPVAGQDNNSQGFRDNFTNTKTNFQYAAAEITDLENKAVLKSALTGTTLNNNMNGSILSNFQGQNISETVVALGTLSGDVDINFAAGPYQTVTTAGSISLAFTNWTPAGTADSVLVQVTITNVAYTLTLPTAVGAGASATSVQGIQGIDTITNTITFGATGTYIFEFITTDSGSTIYINDLTRGRNSFSGPLTITDTTQSTSTTTGALTVAGGVGIVGNLYVGGNIVGNIEIENISSIVGNVTAGNLLTGGLVSATGNVTGGNVRTAGIISATGNITSGANMITTGYAVHTLGVQSTGVYNGANTAGITIDYLTGNGRISVGPSDGINFYNGNVGNTLLVSISTAGAMSAIGNITGGNLLTGGLLSATGNVIGGNLRTTGSISATGNVTSGNVLTGGLLSATGNVTSGNVLTGGLLSATGNITGANITISGAFTGNLNIQPAVRANITSTNTYALSTTNSINLLVANNTGYTATLNMPATPVNGQICNFAVQGNTVTLVVGTGTVSPSFAGLTAVGYGYRYVYYTSDVTWYRVG